MLRKFLSFVPFSGGKKRTLADPGADAAFDAGIRTYLSSAQKAPPPHDVEENADCIHKTSYAKSIQRLATAREEELRLAQEILDKAKRLENKILDGRIPEFSDDQAWGFPKHFWGRISVGLFGIAGAALPVFETFMSAWYIRFETQSLPVAILFCSLILFFPIAELAVLHSNLISNKTKKIVLFSQVIIGALAAILYVSLTLRHGDTSLVSMFSRQVSSISTDTFRMGAQIVTSICVSALCLHCAIRMGRRHAPKNQEFENAELEVEEKRKAASQNFDTVGEISGELERIQKRLPQGVLFCQRQFARIEAEHDRHNSTLQELFNEPISI